MANRRPVYQYFDPNTGRLITAPQKGVLQPMLGPPVQARRRRGFGDIPPNSAGGPGNSVYPYDETEIWNPPSGPGGSSSSMIAVAPNQTSVSNATSNVSNTGFNNPALYKEGGVGDMASPQTMPFSYPFGEAGSWSNPTTFATVPINSGTGSALPVLSQNSQRNSLIIQNNSTATATGDVAPILYVGFNNQPIVGFALALAPGVGIAWDIITPRDSIYVVFGPQVNTGGSVVVRGAVIQGTYAP